MKNLIVFILFMFQGIKGANILVLLPLPLYSHTNAFMPVFKELVARGHNLTMVSPFPQKEPIANWTDIVIDKEPYAEFYASILSGFYDTSPYSFFPQFWKFCAGAMQIAYQDDTLQRLIKDENLNFDLIIMEPLFAHESLVAFSHKLKIPVVGIYPLPVTAWLKYVLSNELPYSYVPNIRTSYTGHMNFIQRMDNAIINLIEFVTGAYHYFPIQENLMEKYMVYNGSENRPPLIEMLRNVSLHLIDSHHSIGYVQPLAPDIIEVGGLSLKSSEALPSDLQKYMDNSKNGVIYLSFGSNVQVSTLDKTIIDAILNTFRNLDLNVLMKWENETMPDKPNNVEIRRWFPQPNILAHPKCRLFITHGGMHGVTEAAFHGVPIVGIPFFSDQVYNMRFAESEGFGIMVLRKDLTEKTLQHAIESVLSNKSYKENALRRSKISKDRPQSALDTAIYWIEYVLNHKDTSHLKPASLKLSFYQVYLLDVILVITLVLLTPFILIYILCKLIFKLCTKTKPLHKRKSKKE